jgi:hypothetical protein
MGKPLRVTQDKVKNIGGDECNGGQDIPPEGEGEDGEDIPIIL